MDYTTSLLSEVNTIVNSYSRINKMSGQNFNLFTLLRSENDEVRLHSRFISELLDTKGSHQQGSLFLDLFLKQVAITGFETKNAQCHPEYYIGAISKDRTQGGNIDILIRSVNEKVIKIENKVDANEQENQLLRYHNYRHKGHLIYLTKVGEESKIHDKLLKADVTYQQISYKDDITAWLQECIEKCATVPIVRESIVQYLNLVKKITFQNINKVMSKEIVGKITQNKESFKAYLEMRKTENNNGIYKDIIVSNLIPFFEHFADSNELAVENLEKSLISDRVRYNGFFFTHNKLTKYGLKLSVQFANSANRDMYYGLSFLQENPRDHIIYGTISKEAKLVMDKSKERNGWWLCCSFWEEYKNWGEVDALYKMVYGNFQREFTAKMKAVLLMAFSVIDNYEAQSIEVRE